MTPVPKVRFAPSPTGYLHVGNIRTALVNFLFSRKTGGKFLLRLDDTDRERSRPEYEEGIKRDLGWLGLAWDGMARQADRMELYAAAQERLIAAGRLYPCFETQEELDIKRRMLASRGLPPVYDRAALQLTEAQKQEYARQGKKPHWRFLLQEGDIAWDDLIRGPVVFHGAHVSDPVLVREDGMPLYTLSSVVDDGEMGITHVIRGEDHVSNTAVQVQIFEAFGYAPPRFAHMALLAAKDGKLSKREGGGDVRSLRAKGVFPLAIHSYLGRIGTSDPMALADSMEELAQGFDFAKMGRAAAQYDEEALIRLNAGLLHRMAFGQVREWLERDASAILGESVGAAMDETFWLAVRGNISTLEEIGEWWALAHRPVAPVIADAAYCRAAAELLPEDWNAEAWDRFIARIKEATGRKGKALFMPLRLALTGREDGPELKALFFLLGREKAGKRLRGETA